MTWLTDETRVLDVANTKQHLQILSSISRAAKYAKLSRYSVGTTRPSSFTNGVVTT